jgi:prepilin peptidase CpaA
MPTDPATQMLIFAVVAGLLLLACWQDVATRTLPEGVNIAVALIGVGLHLAFGGLVAALVAGIFVFAFGFALWWLGAIGGGDVKLLAACALLVGAPGVPVLLLAMALAGGLLSVAYLAGRRWPPARLPRSAGLAARVWRTEARRLGRGGPLPYGLAIAAGTLFTLALGA